MDGQDFLTALALLLIFEGLLPFATPDRWKEMLRSIVEVESPKVRIYGLMSMISGLMLLYWLK
ncbi:MAG: DUF2065 domain-containing protein [Gammaproteobacteria bacterium]|nr:MAG: DUF2065 domain-containing protein [Gammaproteobacteria bacterium]